MTLVCSGWRRAEGSGTRKVTIRAVPALPLAFMQLWLLLPPGEEIAETEYFNLQPNDIPRSGNTRVLLGEYGGVKADQMISHNVTYLDVSLGRGETWNLTPAARPGSWICLSALGPACDCRS